MNDRQRKRRKLEHEGSQLVTYQPSHPPWKTSLLSFDMPMILSNYAFMLFYVLFMALVLILLYQTFRTLQLEIQEQIQQQIQAQVHTIDACSQKYQDYNCDRSDLAPVLLSYCLGWSKCMQDDPYNVKKIDAAARVFGDLINTFCNALSFKTMIAICLVVFFTSVFSLL
ncbi:hypothetical protein DM01DRAFT_301039 [Hesseltinella vesiculosa]|uniref:Brl1/Brr6 domain-containing protein n=1 Tax=Hesseltinella vesiculosa TaxID=101127 RepID=A0A1X2GW43_9FUNG|nr:hypothetical protein DM01DRAFT_301039 [Hesseltinella vesiculosa]